MSLNCEDYGVTEQQTVESLLVASQAKVLNVIARLAIVDTKAAYRALQEILPHGTIHPDLHGLEYAIIYVIANVAKKENTSNYVNSRRRFAALEKRLGFRLAKGGNA